jgi:hypothetical protein
MSLSLATIILVVIHIMLPSSSIPQPTTDPETREKACKAEYEFEDTLEDDCIVVDS